MTGTAARGTAARSLFRIQAIDSRRGRMSSGTTLRPPLPLGVLTAALAATVAAMAGFLATQTYARKAEASGYLAPMHGVVRVMPPRAGVIVAVSVADGDIVRSGDPLLRVDAGRRSIGGADIDGAMRQALVQQRDLELAQVALGEATARSEGQRLHERIDRLEEECQALRQQLSLQRDREGLADEQASVSRGMVAKGLVSAVEQRRREDARFGQKQAIETLQQQISAKAGELVELRFALSQLPGRTADRSATLRVAAAEIDSRLAEAEGQRAYLVAAPASGRVSAVQASAGNQADPTRPLLSIVPEGEDLQAVLFVPERAIGFVAPGQEVRLSLDAFPFQRFGAQSGTITSIARTLLRPEQLDSAVPPPSEPCYRVTVALAAQTLTAYGRAIPLQADMQLHAHIIFDRRSFGQWLLDPLLSAQGRS